MEQLVYPRRRVEMSDEEGGAAPFEAEGEARGMSEPSEFLLENLQLVRQVTASICRRRGFSPDEIEDFLSEVQLRLISNDYAILRAFRGRSSFSTYLAAVVTRQLLDHRNQQWGKWHASAEAERLGEVAIAVERAVYRDHHSSDEALAALVTVYPCLTREDVDGLLTRLPRRVRRRRVDLDEATTVASPDSGVDVGQTQTAVRISGIVAGYIARLPKDEQLILRLRFDSELSVAEIARSLHIDQPALYRRLYGHFHRLRIELEREGVAAFDVAALIGTDAVALDFGLKNDDVGPSGDRERAASDRQEDLP
jgi:RNA polymerase sigma factor (sigma-70 family)